MTKFILTRIPTSAARIPVAMLSRDVETAAISLGRGTSSNICGSGSVPRIHTYGGVFSEAVPYTRVSTLYVVPLGSQEPGKEGKPRGRRSPFRNARNSEGLIRHATG